MLWRACDGLQRIQRTRLLADNARKGTSFFPIAIFVFSPGGCLRRPEKQALLPPFVRTSRGASFLLLFSQICLGEFPLAEMSRRPFSLGSRVLSKGDGNSAESKSPLPPLSPKPPFLDESFYVLATRRSTAPESIPPRS